MHRGANIAVTGFLTAALFTPGAAQNSMMSGVGRSELLDRPAKLVVHGEKLANALAMLQRTSGVPIAFSPSLIPADHRISCECETRTVGQALYHLLDPDRFRLVAMNGQVLIEPIVDSAVTPELATVVSLAHAPPERTRVGEDRIELELLRVGNVNGRIVDASTRAPLVGVQVGIEGTTLGGITNAEGRYLIADVPAGVVSVRAILLGYRTAEQETTVEDDATATVDFEMDATAIELEQIVATVDAATVRRRELGTDIASINVEGQLATAAVQSFSDLLNARAANVSISPASGLVGAGSRIRIRGTNSLTQDNNPLIVIDGVRATNSTDLGPIGTGGQTSSRFDDLNPEEIQSVQVIKGPSATALYGSEGAAGVIVITTKRGRAGDNEVIVSSRVGVSSNPAEFPDTYMNLTPFYGVTDLDDPRLTQFRLEQNTLTGDIFALDNPLQDPDSRPFRDGMFTTLNLSYRGGSENVTYYTNGEYQYREGVIPSNDLRRFSWRGNGEIRPHANVDLSVNAGFITSNRSFPDDNSIASGVGIGGMLGSPVSSFGTDPQLGPGKGICLLDALMGSETGRCDASNGNFGAGFDKLLSIDQGEKLSRFTTSASLTWRPFSRLTGMATAGIDQSDRRAWDLTPFDPDLPFGQASLGSVNDYREASRVVTADGRLTLAQPLGSRVSSATTVGGQYFQRHIESTRCTGQEFPNDAVEACGAGQISRGFSSRLENVEIGAFVQERLGYRDYLFLTGAVRVDDNSSLGARSEAIWSPSLNASLVVSDLPFWSMEAIDDLRVRIAWGKASQSPGQYQADRTFTAAPVTIDGTPRTGITANAPGNDVLGPERTEELETGFDVSFLDNRLGATFTYFSMTTRNLIVPAPVAPSTGFPGLAFRNLGSMESDGIEVNLDAAVVETPRFGWDLRFRASTVHPVITELGVTGPIIFPVGADGGSRAAGSQVFQTGFAPGAYISEVITSATRDADGRISSFEKAPGTLGDGSDRRVVGQPFPTNEQSLASEFSFGERVRASILFDRAAGHEILNVTQAFRTPFVDNEQSSSYSREYALREVLLSPERQAMVEQRMLAAFIEKGDFIKLREVTLSYELGGRLAGLIGGSTANVTLGARNLYTWTDFTGLDPEMNVVGARDDFTSNNFAGSFPPARTFWLSFRVNYR